MGKEIESEDYEMEQEASTRRTEVHVTRIAKKCVYSLPSGRKMIVILEDEAEPTHVTAHT